MVFPNPWSVVSERGWDRTTCLHTWSFLHTFLHSCIHAFMPDCMSVKCSIPFKPGTVCRVRSLSLQSKSRVCPTVREQGHRPENLVLGDGKLRQTRSNSA